MHDFFINYMFRILKLAKLGHMRPIYIEDLDELDNLNIKSN